MAAGSSGAGASGRVVRLCWNTAETPTEATRLLAEAAGQIDPRYQRNIEALRSVQPQDLEPAEIEARLGSPWIPRSDVGAFLVELLEVPRDSIKVGFAKSIATWTVETEPNAKYVVNNTTVHGTRRFRASELVEQALNGRTPTAYDEDADGNRVVNQPETIAAREKQQQLKDRFQDWVWEDKDRATRLAHDYNHRFNNIRLREFDGSHLSFPGMNRGPLRDGDLAPHQKNAVWRILEGGSPLLAHVVGAGKTWTMAAAAMELRRLELAKKPMFIVPNHLVAQWGAEFLKLYPQAKLFVAGKEHFSTGKRQEAMARIATGHYDAVIVSHKSFEFLPVSDKYFNRFVEKQVAELDSEIESTKAAKEDNRRVVKELEKAKKRLVVRLKKRADRDSKDRTLTFEELGVDQLFVDESDLYKNLAYSSKMSRIAGMPNSDSNRAFDMFLKIRYLQEQQGGGGAVFATGTPISNSLAEMYTTLRYLAPQMLEERNVNHFDSWAANFAEAVTSLELSPDGAGYRMNTRFAKFINLPELLQMFRCVADVQTADMLKLPRPELQHGRPSIEAAAPSPELKAFIRTLTERAVGNRLFSGKGAREDAASALAGAILSWREDQTLQPRAWFRGFEILSKGRGTALGMVEQDERPPEVFVRGNATYSANFSGSSPVGTVQSIEHTLRNLDRLAGEQRTRVATLEKELTDYRVQSDRPFELEARLQELLTRQADLTRMLELDKGDQQSVEADPDAPADRESLSIVEAAESFMRESGNAIKDMDVTERKPPDSGAVSGRAVAKLDTQVAIATSPNSFVVIQLNGSAGRIAVGERVTVRMQQGVAMLEEGIGRGR